MDIESFFQSHPIFRYEEFVEWRGASNKHEIHNIRMLLQHHTKSGRIASIRRGLYVVIPFGESLEDLLIDPYLIAAKITNDSVLAYHTALELHGVAYSVFEQFTFTTKKKIKPFQYQQHWYQPVATPNALKKQPSAIETTMIDRQGLAIEITNIERTFVDVIDRADLSGGWEEVSRSLTNIAVLTIEKVVDYCLLLNNRRLAAKVGFFLQQRQGAFAVDDNLLAPLLALKPLTPQYLSQQKPNKLIKQWNLIVPLTILNQSWEDIDHAI